MKSLFTLLSLSFLSIVILPAQSDHYFPPLSGDDWQSLSPASLGWNTDSIAPLYDFLEEKNSKAFLVVHQGKMVLEEYFGTFTRDSLWYWASAGKTITAFLVGKAQEEGFLDIRDTTSQYLGEGWTSMSAEKEEKITLWHQLTMTGGLETSGVNWDCTDPECLTYRVDAGERWFYHNAPYTLLKDVLSEATGKSANLLTFDWLNKTIGMGGAWVQVDWNNVYFSTARDMARFGHMILNQGEWDGTQLMSDKQYIHDMTHASQVLNPAYGYLFWLNGSDFYRQPGLDLTFDGSIIPAAPADMFAGLGKNDQKLYVIPSLDMVVVRMGNAADDGLLALSGFDNELWERLGHVISPVTGRPDKTNLSFDVYPNPASDMISIRSVSIPEKLEIRDITGSLVLQSRQSRHMEIHDLSAGIYFLRISIKGHHAVRKIMVSR